MATGNHRFREAVERCLEKDANKRYRDIGDVKTDIERVATDPTDLPARVTSSGTSHSSKIGWALAVAFALALVASFVLGSAQE